MNEIQIQPLTRDDGVHAFVSGLGRDFRFRIGEGSVSQLEIESAIIWAVEGHVGHYSLQFIPHTLITPTRAEAIEELISHYHWESGFLREQMGAQVDEQSVGVLQHPEGTPVLTWISRRPESQPNVGITHGGSRDEAKPVEEAREGSATPYAANATLLHSSKHLLHFVVTGLDSTWTEENVRLQVLRAAFSYFTLGEVSDFGKENQNLMSSHQ